MRAMFLPLRRCCSKPPYLAAFRSAESLSRNLSSSGVKSSSLTKLRLRKLNAIVNYSFYDERFVIPGFLIVPDLCTYPFERHIELIRRKMLFLNSSQRPDKA